MFDPGLRGLRAAVTGAGSACEPALMDLGTTVAALGEWTKIANTAAAVTALLSARIDELGAPRSAGASSAAEFIARTTGTTTAQGARQIKTGKQLGGAEQTRERAARGELSTQQIEAIADAVAADPAAEASLLHAVGRSSVGQLREACARTKAAADADPDATRARIHRNRRLRRWADADGTEHLHASGSREQMARLDQRLAAEIDAIFEAARAEGVREPHEAYAFDALIRLADAEASAPSKKARYLGLLRIDLEALVRGRVEGEEICEIAGLGPIAVATARRLLGEANLKLVITDGVDVRNVTHLGRSVSAVQRIALLWEQPVCSRELCGKRGRLENDHREPWAKVKVTELVNIDPLCDDDHDLKTHKGWALVEGTGIRPMVPPDDPRHPRWAARRASREPPSAA